MLVQNISINVIQGKNYVWMYACDMIYIHKDNDVDYKVEAFVTKQSLPFKKHQILRHFEIIYVVGVELNIFSSMRNFLNLS